LVKKKAPGKPEAFQIFYNQPDYLPGAAGFVVVGAGALGNVIGAVFVGIATGLEAFSIFSFRSGLSDFCTPFFTETLIANDNTINVMAKIQVPFSKKSPVFCTPINCDELEKFDDKPPPLGFWINTISTSSAQTMIAMINNNKYISYILIGFLF
jgi:hypothetical protein